MTDPHGALVYTMVLASASDGTMSDNELETLSETVRFLPVFRGFDRSRIEVLSRECATMLQDEDGLDQAIARINAILIEEFEAEACNLHPKAQLNADLGLDSLDGVDLVVAIEKAFNYRIPEAEAREIRTLQDIYDQVTRRLRPVDSSVKETV